MEEAIYSDCCLLVSNFVQNENPSFSSFCEEWKKLHFQHIFAAQTTYTELRQTVAAAFHIGKRLATITTNNTYEYLSDFDDTNEATKILIRIGGLYLLYAIYFKQPLEQYTKIEVSLETWRALKEFICVQLTTDIAEHNEARYIFWKLYQSQAFRFTAMDYCAGLENLVDYDYLDRTETNSAIPENFSGVGRLINKFSSFDEIKQSAPTLVALEDNYNQMKSSLTKQNKLDRQLLPPTNVFHSIRESFENIEKIINDAEKAEEIHNRNEKSLKRALKDQAFQGFKKNSKTPRTVLGKCTRKQLRRMSSRTIFSEKLPADMEETRKDNAETEENASDTESESQANDGADISDYSIESENPVENEAFNIKQETKLCHELLDDL